MSTAVSKYGAYPHTYLPFFFASGGHGDACLQRFFVFLVSYPFSSPLRFLVPHLIMRPSLIKVHRIFVLSAATRPLLLCSLRLIGEDDDGREHAHWSARRSRFRLGQVSNIMQRGIAFGRGEGRGGRCVGG